jgi:outer membrane protein, heavy metal efflux system
MILAAASFISHLSIDLLMNKFLFTILSALLLVGAHLQIEAQTLRDSTLNFQQAKARLIKKNLSLLAAFYDIDISEARLIQSKLWNNPYFIWNQELYSVEKNQYLNYQNQFLVQVEQVFSIAGKHTNTVKLARINVSISKAQFQDVLRSLLYELGSTYNELASLQAKSSLYKSVLASFEALIVATREQLRLGAISGAAALRLESEYRAVKSQAVQNANDQEKALASLRILLQIPADSTVQTTQQLPLQMPSMQIDTLVNQALDTRPDLKIAQLNKEYQERNLKLQQSQSIPDVKIGFQPNDKGSNYVRPYSGINLEFPLPLFDRNQGRIKEAKYSILQSQYSVQLQKSKISNEVMASYQRLRHNTEGIQTYTPDFMENLRTINISVNQNFQKRNISLLEFIDQQRIYITTNLQLIELKQQYLDCVNDLNFSVGTQVIEN